MAVTVQRVKDKLRDILQTHGSSKTKQRLWDKEFSNGRWDILDVTTEDCVYDRIARWSNGGSILDLGCGSGNTANELDNSAFQQYVGVDISESALAKARTRTEENGRAAKCRFVQGDVVNYVPAQKANVILFRESIYYIKRPQLIAVLNRYAQSLEQDGVFIVRIWNGNGKLKWYADLIHDNFNVVDEYRHQESGTMIFVFRCLTKAEKN